MVAYATNPVYGRRPAFHTASMCRPVQCTHSSAALLRMGHVGTGMRLLRRHHHPQSGEVGRTVRAFHRTEGLHCASFLACHVVGHAEMQLRLVVVIEPTLRDRCLHCCKTLLRLPPSAL